MYEEIFQQGGGEGHIPIRGAEEPGYRRLVFGAEGREERELRRVRLGV